MAALEKIRTKFGTVISIIIALALLSFIIDPSTLESALNAMSSRNDVGVIDGKSISNNDFSASLEKYNLVYGNLRSEQDSKMVRDEAWGDLVIKHLFNKRAAAAGVTVGNGEMADLVFGENPSPLVANAFIDANGLFSPESRDQFYQSTTVDAGNAVKWEYLCDKVYNMQVVSKYNNLFVGASVLNDIQKERLLAQNNATANVDYVLVNYPFTNDSTLVVKDDDIRKFYDDHKDNYIQKANRDIEYVVFSITPSAEDVAEEEARFAENYEKFSTLGSASEIRSFLRNAKSERDYSEHWYKAGELRSVNTEISDFVDANTSGVSEVARSGNTFMAARILDSKLVPDSVFVQHILLSADAKNRADSLCAVAARGGDFSALAAEFSLDQNSAAEGVFGSLGWMTQTNVLPGFEKLVTAPVNVPQVVRTQYGLHVVKVARRSAPLLKKQVAIYERTAEAGNATRSAILAQANDFAAAAGHDIKGFRDAVEAKGVPSHKMTIYESTESYGQVEQAKSVTQRAFELKEGKVSDRIDVANNYYFVVAVDKARKEGIRSLKDMYPSIKARLTNELRAQTQKEKVAADIAGLGSIEEIAQKLGVEVDHDPAMSLSLMSAYGADPAFAGAVFASKDNPGVISKPVAGAMGTYVFKVNSVENGASFTGNDADMTAQRMAAMSAQGIIDIMASKGVVKDNRDRFF